MFSLSTVFKRIFGSKKQESKSGLEEYHELIENSLVGYFIIQEQRFKFVNKTFCSLLEYDPDELINKRPMDLICKEDRAVVEEKAKIFREALKPIEEEFRITKKSGEVIWVKILASNSTFKGLRAISGSLIQYDERKQLQQQLKQSEERLRMTLEVTQIGIWEWDIERDVWFASPIYYTMLGYEPEEGHGDRAQWVERVHPDDREKVSQTINEVLRQGKKEYVYQARMRHANGSYRWQYVAGYIVGLNSLGDVSRMVGIRRDIHDFKLAMDHVKQSEDRLRTLINTIPDLVWLKDADGIYLQCNQRFETLYGASEEDIIGKTDYDFVSKELADFFRGKDKDAILSGGPVANEEEVSFADGHKEILETIKTPLFEDNGKLLGVLGIGRNITEKKKNQLELENYREHLEKLVKKRTEELKRSNKKLHRTNTELTEQKEQLQEALNNLNKTKNQLIQSEKMASLGVLAAGIAHEINNPLNFILGGSCGLEHYVREHLEGQFQEVEPFLNTIKEGTQRATAIVRSLNHYSNNKGMAKSNCDIHVIIDNCLIMLRNQLRDKVEVVKHYSEESVFVFGNEGKLHQVFLNILTNAEQAIESTGSITITTTLADGHLLVSIADTGMGMSSETKSKLFDPFYTTKDPGMGCGLGLSIVYNIILEHDGSIAFESELNRGTTATLKFPLSDSLVKTGAELSANKN